MNVGPKVEERGMVKGGGAQSNLHLNYKAGAASPGVMAQAERSRGFNRHFPPHQILFGISQFHFPISINQHLINRLIWADGTRELDIVSSLVCLFIQ